MVFPLRAAVLLSLVVLAACGSSGPEDVAREIVDAAARGDLEGMRAHVVAKERGVASLKVIPKGLQVGDAVIDGDRAVVPCTPASAEDARLSMVLLREEDAWRMSLSGTVAQSLKDLPGNVMDGLKKLGGDKSAGRGDRAPK